MDTETGDRISERYCGLTNRLFSEDAVGRARTRIHWMCKRVRGRRVIDIGCSQGIASILLAREGFEVFGIDIADKAIEFANVEKSKEPQEVQQRLKFIRGSIYDVDLPAKGFDTAVMGEFLEHQVRPDKAITRAYELLIDDGKLIITVPFGLFRDPDHKQTFYMASLYKLIFPYFEISEVEIVGKYLCFLCKKRQVILEHAPDTIELTLAEKSENAFRDREVTLTTELEATKQKLSTEISSRVRAEQRYTHIKKEFDLTISSNRYQLGSMLVEAIRTPGLHTILLPYRMLRLGTRVLKRTTKPSTVKIMTSPTPRTKPSPPQQKKAINAADTKTQILEEIRREINDIMQKSRASTALSLQPRRKDLTIAAIMDKFTLDCLKYEANLITFTPDNWKQVLSENKPNFLLVDSAWQDNSSTWGYDCQTARLSQNPRNHLRKLVQWCKDQSIPTAFWNKEDPSHYDSLLDVSVLFDYVYTTDFDCVARYKNDLKHDRVYCLPLAIQPKIHNPIGSSPKTRKLAFAGSWCTSESEDNKHLREQMANVLAPALQYDVDIYDRHHKSNDERYRVPEQYQPHIVGELSYEEMVYAYRMYDVFLNVNNVADSPTMFSRGVLEILASGTCVISGYAKGIENLIGSDIVKMSRSPEETSRHLNLLFGNKELRDRLSLMGLRKIMREHTYEQRLNYILDTMGIIKTENGPKRKGISIITCTNKPNFMAEIFDNYDRQKYEPKELIIILNNNQLDLDAWIAEAQMRPSAAVYRVDEKEGLGTCLNYAIDRIKYDYVAKFDDDDYYAPFYVQDMLNAFEYSNADIVGKSTVYAWLESDSALVLRRPEREHRYMEKNTTTLCGATFVIKKDVFNHVKFRPGKGNGRDTDFILDCQRHGFKMYATDRFNYLTRRFASKDTHTWRVDDEDFLSRCVFIAYTRDCIAHVTC